MLIAKPEICIKGSNYEINKIKCLSFILLIFFILNLLCDTLYH